MVALGGAPGSRADPDVAVEVTGEAADDAAVGAGCRVVEVGRSDCGPSSMSPAGCASPTLPICLGWV